MLTIARRPTDDVRWWVIQARIGTDWYVHVVDGALSEMPVSRLESPRGDRPDIVTLLPVGRTGVGGVPVAIRVR